MIRAGRACLASSFALLALSGRGEVRALAADEAPGAGYSASRPAVQETQVEFPLWPLTADEQLLWQSGERPPVTNLDTDGDGLADIDEELLLLDPLDEHDGRTDRDLDGFDEAWEWYIGSDPLSEFDPADRQMNLLALAQASMEPPFPVPTLTNGDFSQHGELERHHPYYPNGGFDYDWLENGSVTGWEAIEGTRIEVWSDGDGRTGVVELEAQDGHSGIRQLISFTEAGTYLIQWDQCGRKDSPPHDDLSPEDSAFVASVAQKDEGGQPDATATYRSRTQNSVEQIWATTGLLVAIPPQAIRDEVEIWLFFKPTANSTRGALIDQVSVHRIKVFEQAPNSGFDRTPIPTTIVNEDSPAMMVPMEGENSCSVQVHPALAEEFRQELEIVVSDDAQASLADPLPALAIAEPEVLTVEGREKGHLEVQLRQTGEEAETLGNATLLQVDVKEREEVPLVIYYYHDPRHGPAWQAPTQAQILEKLNDITWGKQANVFFEPEEVEVQMIEVEYDIDLDGILDTDPAPGEAFSAEEKKLLPSLVYPIEEGRAICFVRTIPNGSGLTIFDQQVSLVSLSFNPNEEQDNLDDAIHIAAHEAGHLLGLRHENGGTFSDGSNDAEEEFSEFLYEQTLNLMFWRLLPDHPLRIVSEDWNLVNP